MTRTWVLALAAAACGGHTEPRAPSIVPSDAIALPVHGAPSAPPASRAIDVLVATTTISTGAVVIEIGRPRMRLVAPTGALKIRGQRLFAADGEQVKIFDLASGDLVQRAVIGVPVESLVVSDDGAWLAAGDLTRTSVLKAPFDRVELDAGKGRPHAFTRSALVMTRGEMFLLDLVTHKRTGKDARPGSGMLTLGVAAGATNVDWVTDAALLHWDYGEKLRVVAKPAVPWTRAEIALRARVAIVTDATALARLDFTTGQLSDLGPATFSALAISPSGRALALADGNVVRLLDTVRGAETDKFMVGALARRLAFGDRDDVLAYTVMDEGVVRVRDLGTGERTYPDTSRFHAWGPTDTIVVERDGVREQVALSTLARTAEPSLRPTVDTGAPSWATWIEHGATGEVIAAEASPVHELSPDRRWQAVCASRLRVWTRKGGERVFSLKPTHAQGKDLRERTDPCWRIAGGHVVAATTEAIRVFDPVTGAQLANLDPGIPPYGRKHPDFAHEYWEVTVDPSGTHLALWWRRVDEFPPPRRPTPEERRTDALHQPADKDLSCTEGANGQCIREYFAEVWTLGAKPRRLWQERFDSSRTRLGRSWPLSRIPSSPIAFTPDGSQVLFGFDDGDILVRSVDNAKAPARSEAIHRDPISRIHVSPDGRWVFSEDRSGEQRVWPLAP